MDRFSLRRREIIAAWKAKANVEDPLEPFRAEFERIKDDWDNHHVCILKHEEFEAELNADGYTFNLDRDPHYRAAKALKIAETEGPDAALLWKLSRD